ncbi:MAG: PaaI family thioesterase [Phycisphaerae bacterium]
MFDPSTLPPLDPQRLAAILDRSRTAPCIASLGIELRDARAGFCRLTAKHDPRFNGLLPGFHGGMLANVADCAAWFAVVTRTEPDEPLVTTDLHLRYLNPCLGDVTATARLIKFGKTLCPVAIDLYDPQGEHVAVGQVTYIRVGNLGAVPR